LKNTSDWLKNKIFLKKIQILIASYFRFKFLLSFQKKINQHFSYAIIILILFFLVHLQHCSWGLKTCFVLQHKYSLPHICYWISYDEMSSTHKWPNGL
jgi:hypothetical protein